MSRTNATKYALIPIAALLLLSAAPITFAKDPGPQGYAAFAGTYTLPDGSQWAVGVFLTGTSLSSLSGVGAVCQVDPATLVCKAPGPSSFQATGAVTVDSTTGLASFNFVVKDPGPQSFPGGSALQCGGTTVTSFSGPTACSTGTSGNFQVTISFPTGAVSSVSGNTIFFGYIQHIQPSG